jgi:hypothetical protein
VSATTTDSERRSVTFAVPDEPAAASPVTAPLSPIPADHSSSPSSLSPDSTSMSYYDFDNGDDVDHNLDVEPDAARQQVDDDDDEESEQHDYENAEEYARKKDQSSQLEDADVAADLTDRTLRAMAKSGCVLPPVNERADIIARAHLMGHYGRRAMATRIIRSGKYWPTLHADIQDAIADCQQCSRAEVRTSGFHPARTINAPLPGDHY